MEYSVPLHSLVTQVNLTSPQIPALHILEEFM